MNDNQNDLGAAIGAAGDKALPIGRPLTFARPLRTFGGHQSQSYQPLYTRLVPIAPAVPATDQAVNHAINEVMDRVEAEDRAEEDMDTDGTELLPKNTDIDNSAFLAALDRSPWDQAPEPCDQAPAIPTGSPTGRVTSATKKADHSAPQEQPETVTAWPRDHDRGSDPRERDRTQSPQPLHAADPVHRGAPHQPLMTIADCYRQDRDRDPPNHPERAAPGGSRNQPIASARGHTHSPRSTKVDRDRPRPSQDMELDKQDSTEANSARAHPQDRDRDRRDRDRDTTFQKTAATAWVRPREPRDSQFTGARPALTVRLTIPGAGVTTTKGQLEETDPCGCPAPCPRQCQQTSQTSQKAVVAELDTMPRSPDRDRAHGSGRGVRERDPLWDDLPESAEQREARKWREAETEADALFKHGGDYAASTNRGPRRTVRQPPQPSPARLLRLPPTGQRRGPVRSHDAHLVPHGTG